MMSEELLERYVEAYCVFEKVVEGSKFYIRHRSLKKYEDKTNQDIYFIKDDQTVCAVYVGKDTYKIWLDNPVWYKLSRRKPTEIDSNGYYKIFCTNIDDCVDEVKSILIRNV